MRRLLVLLFLLSFLYGEYSGGEGVRTFTPIYSFSISPLFLAYSISMKDVSSLDYSFFLRYPIGDGFGAGINLPLKADRMSGKTRAAVGPARLLIVYQHKKTGFGVAPFIQWSPGWKKGYNRLLSSGTAEYGVVFIYSRSFKEYVLHLNAGAASYYNYKDAAYYGDFMPLRALFIKKDRFSPFVELSYDWFPLESISIGPFKKDREKLYGNSPLFISLGANYSLNNVLEVKGGMTFKLSKYNGDSLSYYSQGNPGFEIFAGVSMSGVSLNFSKERRGRALKGLILDRETKSPVVARIFVEGPDIEVKTDESGVFLIENLQTGLYRIHISAPGYKRATRIVGVTSYRGEDFVFYLEREEEKEAKTETKPAPGYILLEVSDKEGNPLTFTVYADGEEYNSNLIEVKKGTHLITIKSPGYREVVRSVEVEEGDTLLLKVNLERVTETLPRIYFGLDSYEVPEEELTKLEKVADFLKENPSYSLLIIGYSSTDGDSLYNRILSERRAAEVKGLLIELFKIEPKRLKDVGKGEVGGDPSESRRVEFKLFRD